MKRIKIPQFVWLFGATLPAVPISLMCCFVPLSDFLAISSLAILAFQIFALIMLMRTELQ